MYFSISFDQDLSLQSHLKVPQDPLPVNPYPTPHTKAVTALFLKFCVNVAYSRSSYKWDHRMYCFSLVMLLWLIHVIAFTNCPFLLLLSSIPLYEYTIVYLSVILLIGIYHIVFFILNNHIIKLAFFFFLLTYRSVNLTAIQISVATITSGYTHSFITIENSLMLSLSHPLPPKDPDHFILILHHYSITLHCNCL